MDSPRKDDINEGNQILKYKFHMSFLAWGSQLQIFRCEYAVYNNHRLQESRKGQ